jgi:type IX secretion system PorP/SprF family membrane protein
MIFSSHTKTFEKSIVNQTFIMFIAIISGLVMGNKLQAQQESMYSQYMFNMLHINPAFAGFRASDNITLLYRNQWVGVTGAPKTACISWDKRANENNMGYGVELYNDQLGIEKTNGIQGFYSYYVSFEESYLSLGISGGVLNYNATYSKTKAYTSGDPVFQTDENGWLPTAGFGVLYVTPLWYVGFSVPALLHTKINAQNYLNQNNLGANNHYFLTGGYSIPLNENMKLKSSAMIKAVKGSPLQYDLNLIWWSNNLLGVGASYRSKDALVGILEFQITPKLRLGYAYDYTFSALGDYNQGTHEVMLRIEIPNKKPCTHCAKQD